MILDEYVERFGDKIRERMLRPDGCVSSIVLPQGFDHSKERTEIVFERAVKDLITIFRSAEDLVGKSGLDDPVLRIDIRVMVHESSKNVGGLEQTRSESTTVYVKQNASGSRASLGHNLHPSKKDGHSRSDDKIETQENISV